MTSLHREKAPDASHSRGVQAIDEGPHCTQAWGEKCTEEQDSTFPDEPGSKAEKNGRNQGLPIARSWPLSFGHLGLGNNYYMISPVKFSWPRFLEVCRIEDTRVSTNIKYNSTAEGRCL